MVENGAIVHPSAVIADSAKIERGAFIGKNCVIGENVSVGYNAVVERDTTVGDGTVISANAHVGGDPQDVSFKGEDTKLIIGKDCVVREFVTLNRATTKEDVWETVIGDNCYFMTYSHVGHDCKVGNNVTLVNCVALAGHTIVGNFVTFAGYSASHQFSRVGDGCMIANRASVIKDIPPFCMAAGPSAKIEGLNTVGLKRRGVKPEVRTELKRALKIYQDMTNKLKDIPELLGELQQFEEIKMFTEFLKDSKRSFSRR